MSRVGFFQACAPNVTFLYIGMFFFIIFVKTKKLSKNLAGKTYGL